MKRNLYINYIPAALYGPPTDKVYLYIHGKNGAKEEAEGLYHLVKDDGWQVLSIDLPEHGDRKGNKEKLNPWNVVPEMRILLSYAKERWGTIRLMAISVGAYFSLLSFPKDEFDKVLFVSPIVDMVKLIEGFMEKAGVTAEQLKMEKTISMDFGEELSWDYYLYAGGQPIKAWSSPTEILYGEKDYMTCRESIEDFAQRFDCQITTVKEGGHWLHTESEMAAVKAWICASI